MKIIVFVAFLLFTITACQKADLTLLSEIEGSFESQNSYYNQNIVVDHAAWELAVNSEGVLHLTTPGSTGGFRSRIVNINKYIYPNDNTGFVNYDVLLRNKKEVRLSIKEDTIFIAGDLNKDLFSPINSFKTNIYGLRKN